MFAIIVFSAVSWDVVHETVMDMATVTQTGKQERAKQKCWNSFMDCLKANDVVYAFKEADRINEQQIRDLLDHRAKECCDTVMRMILRLRNGKSRLREGKCNSPGFQNKKLFF